MSYQNDQNWSSRHPDKTNCQSNSSGFLSKTNPKSGHSTSLETWGMFQVSSSPLSLDIIGTLSLMSISQNGVLSDLGSLILYI
jgi:hypothetical protein